MQGQAYGAGPVQNPVSIADERLGLAFAPLARER
jgi:hypothetical protein